MSVILIVNVMKDLTVLSKILPSNLLSFFILTANVLIKKDFSVSVLEIHLKVQDIHPLILGRFQFPSYITKEPNTLN